MARLVNDAVLDAALNYIADNGNTLHVCEGQPTEVTGGTLDDAGTVGTPPFVAELARFTVQTTTVNPDYAIADGDTNGRKLTISAQTNGSITTSGDANHLAITDNANNLIYVTTITTQTITSGGTVDTSAWDIEIADPTA